ncbi:MAG: acyltransferase [Parvibaculales bacterium]
MGLAQRLVSYVKGREVIFDDKVSFGYLLNLSLEKFFALLRGLLKTRQLIFLGRGTTIKASAQLFSEKGVEISNYCQIDCLGQHGLFIGKGSKVGSYSIVSVSGSLADLGHKIEIGRNVGIGEFAHIGGAGSVSIGDDTVTGAYLSIHPENHNFDDKSKPIRLQGVSRLGVHIGKGCWIGAKVTFLDGSSIGNGCVVGAGAVVNKKFADYVVIGGVPARILRHLDRSPK